jgi:predicted TIM-barrel fold metal-dependent hydrolase
MRVVTLEEHVSFPEMTSQIPKEALGGHDNSAMMQQMAPKLADIDGERLKSMDENGITMQVLSVINTGANLLSPADGPAFAQQYNDMLADKIAKHPGRFAAFANLPTTAPAAAADELERTVKTHGFKGALINGLTQDEFLDAPKFAPIFERAEKLGVPIYLHPGLPPQAVVDAYYSDLPKYSGILLSIAGWGWHSETAIHTLRLIVSGTLDRYPKLKLIIGHMGEMLPMMMARCDNAFKPNTAGDNQRTIIETLQQQVYITTSGLFTNPPLVLAIDTFGIDNIMFSVDYPFSTNKQGRDYLDNMALSDDQKEKIAYRNADKILGL